MKNDVSGVSEGIKIRPLAGVIGATAFLALGSASGAAEFTVSNTGVVRSTTNLTVVVTAETKTQAATYPTAVGEPLFWLDAEDREGWMLDASGNVTNLPSKVGTRRLTTDRGSWPGWTGNHYGPLLTTDASLGGVYVLDFCNVGNRRMLVFDPDPASVAAGAPTNGIPNIGTVIQVRNSAAGGGFFMGGGTPSYWYMWHRAVVSSRTSSFNYAPSPVAHSSHMQAPVRNGVMWHNGFATSPTAVGFDTGWETISLQCTSASALATGIGLNDGRSNHAGDSGGFKLAEMLVYDRVLTDDEIAKVEMYLEQKWLGRSRPGWNGDARLGKLSADCGGNVGTDVELAVPSDTTLTVGTVEGGRVSGTAALRKTGAGTVVLNGAANYTGTVKIEAGALSFPAKRATPTLAELPYGLALRFDASDANSLVTETVDDTTRVVLWRNLVTTTTYRDQQIVLRPRTDRAPSVRKDVFGTGLNVLDFEVNKSGGRMLQFTTNETVAVENATAITIDPVATLFAVVGAQEGGGNLMNDTSLSRATTGTTSYTTGIVPTDGGSTIWIDGTRRESTSGYDHPGYQVLAIQSRKGGQPNMVGTCSGMGYAGGLRLAELIVYNRVLTEQEILDVQAYLAKKWFGRATPGYDDGAAADATKPELQSVDTAADTTIEVAAGRTAVVGTLTTHGVLRKTGAGTLWVNELAADGRIVCEGGQIEVKDGADPSATSEIASGASLHLDASQTASLELDSSGAVRRWLSADGETGCGAQTDSSIQRPTVFAADSDQLNGKKVLDFGKACVGSSKYMMLDRELHSIRSVFAVVGLQNGGGFMLGTCKAAPHYAPEVYDFHPACSGTTPIPATGGLFLGNAHAMARGATDICTNGVKIAYNTPVLTNAYMLVEVHLDDNAAMASTLCWDRMNSGRSGGFRFGEILVYEHVLSERERVATRNALMAKWFGAAATALPDPVETSKAIPERTLTIDGDATLETDSDQYIYEIVGAGALAKTGSGTLSVSTLGGYTGVVSVASGTLAVKGQDAAAVPAMATDGLIYRADATQGVTTDANGLVSWANALNDGMSAERVNAVAYDTVNEDLGYLPAVRIPGTRYLRFKKNGENAPLDNIRSILWVIGSQEGGGFLMGGGHDANGNLSCYWHRGNASDGVTSGAYCGNTNWTAFLHSGVSFKQAQRASWWRNGIVASSTTNGSRDPATPSANAGLSGKWDQLTMVLAEGDDANPVNADGFAFDGRMGGSNYGLQRLGEVLIYDRRLTDAERLATEAYLSCKWNVGKHTAATNVTVELASGTHFDPGDGANRYQTVVGAGTVEGSVCLSELVADAAATAVPTITGTLVLADGYTVRLANLPQAFTGRRVIPIYKVTDLDGNLEDAAFTGGDLSAETHRKLVLRGGVLSAVVGNNGFMLIVP